MSDSSRPGVRVSRSAVKATARVRAPGGQWEAEVLDLSVSGVRLRRPEGFDSAAAAIVAMELHSEQLAPLRVQGRLARTGSDDVAYVFEGLGPTQCEHLRELIARGGVLRDGVSS